MTEREALEYEIHCSWWAPHVGWGWAQSLAAWYFGWKTRRKFRRYEASMSERCRVRLVSAGVGPGHPKGRCDHCGHAVGRGEDVYATCTATGYVTLCSACYQAAGNTVR